MVQGREHRLRPPHAARRLARLYEFIDRGTAQRLVGEHLAGQHNRRLFIWSLLSVEHWLATTLD